MKPGWGRGIETPYDTNNKGPNDLITGDLQGQCKLSKILFEKDHSDHCKFLLNFCAKMDLTQKD